MGAAAAAASSNVKDYVMQWIGSEVNKERPRGQWAEGDVGPKPEGKKMKKRPMEWWASLDEERRSARRKKKKPREWWREEFCEELTNKANKKKQKNKKAGVGEAEPKKQQWWQNQSDGDDAEEVNSSRKKLRKGCQRSSDWWADGASSELRIGRRNSQDSGVGVSGDTVPKSGGVSSTPSMRGTVCYAAPEYGGGGPLSEKCDVYSFGVLMLVIISGRRPLQVACSPMSEFERANLVSWARQLARAGKLMDLVDQNICNLDSDQALMCITVALLCLQRSPARRPSMKEVVGMLCGETEPPHLPVEFSPSPPGGFTFKSPKKAR
ncbi:Receptor-like serine/threonine-protein kinase [Acorus gramineus]|uniref:Receptor-like serine/threonine-protein kinase n=1 Tax=Acorus gramineus TaxID=55184 RepID=A0AAV9AC19_ACOGR|nr:Receptor-like serine/threonine-protein kinase [Acorus gramineus]